MTVGSIELQDAFRAVGLSLDDSMTLRLRDSRTFRVLTERMSLASRAAVHDRLPRSSRGRAADSVRILVANRVTEDARRTLPAMGWGWLDLRGHLHVEAENLFVDSAVPFSPQPAKRTSSLAGSAGIEVACLILMRPRTTIGIRPIAFNLSRAPSTVSAVLASMRDEGLVANNLPMLPDLFEAVVDQWKPISRYVRRLPDVEDAAIGRALRLGLDPVEGTSGWALTDTQAAADYGAPIVSRSDAAPDLYVPDEAILARAATLLGRAENRDTSAATLKVAPLSSLTETRFTSPRARQRWPLAHPLFVALDLAQDPGRGREILADWTPPEGFHRVW